MMISARNYAAQAEAGLRNWASLPLNYDNREHDVIAAGFLADTIKNAVHFAIPDGGSIFDDDLKGLKGVQARLPFKSITVEYFCKGGDETEMLPVYSPRRVVVAYETALDGVRATYEKLHPGINDPFASFPDEIGIHIAVINEVEGLWGPCPMSLFMPVTWDYRFNESKKIKPMAQKDSAVRVAGIPATMFPGFYALLVNEYGEEMALRQAVHDISGEVTALLELCEALTCSNVITETLQESSGSNAKRVRNGKLPIYETKVLSIEVPATSSRYVGMISHADRRGPRQHLRRGHIRMLGERRIWVNSCVVGSAKNGRINKSYSVSAGGDV